MDMKNQQDNAELAFDSEVNYGSAIEVRRQKRLALLTAILMMIAYLLSFMDRQILVLMIGPIQRDLELNDTYFSLLHGTAFAMFYVTFGLFMGRLVDTYSRVKIISFSIFLWSLATALCGLAKSFSHLFLARMLVGVGEAGLTPGTLSLFSDIFDAPRRARAFAIYGMGLYLGSGLAFMLGGELIAVLEAMPALQLPLLGTLYSWQQAFLIVGAPGVLLALVIAWIVKEPARGAMESNRSGSMVTAEDQASFFGFLRHYRNNWQPYVGHNLGFGLQIMFAYALMSWLPVIFLRVHHWEVSQVGLSIGLIIFVFGPLGSYLGSMCFQYLHSRGMLDAEMRIGAVSMAGLGLFGMLAVSVASPTLALVASALSFFMMGFPAGIIYSSLQTITPPNLRGQAAAFFLLVGNLLGLGLGPLCVALVTDFFFGNQQQVDQSVQVVALLTMPLSTILVWRVRRYFILSE